MLFALITALSWALGGFASSRIARHYGAVPANALRLTLASLLLLIAVLAGGLPLALPGSGNLVLAGLAHLAFGDLCLYAAYRRLGPRLGVLMVSSLAPPVVLAAEHWMLGTTVGAGRLVCAAGILLAVVFAVAPRERAHLCTKELLCGVAAGIGSGLGMGVSAAFNRVAYARIAEAGLEVSPLSPALIRVAAGAAGVLIWLCLLGPVQGSVRQRPRDLIPGRKRIAGGPKSWLLLAVLFGPVIGVVALMKAYETAPGVLVQATIATLPVFMIPIAWFFDGDAPSRRAVVSGLVAVGLAVALITSGE